MLITCNVGWDVSVGPDVDMDRDLKLRPHVAEHSDVDGDVDQNGVVLSELLLMVIQLCMASPHVTSGVKICQVRGSTFTRDCPEHVCVCGGGVCMCVCG